jgi:Ion channel
MTTVGYGDLSGNTKGEYIISIFFEFLGIVVFSVISSLVVRLLERDYDFSMCVSEKFS